MPVDAADTKMRLMVGNCSLFGPELSLGGHVEVGAVLIKLEDLC